MLCADDVTLRRGGRAILRSVSLALRPGEVTAVIGPNGSGKSTLLRVLSGVLRPDAGTVRIGDIPLGRMRPADLALRRAVLSQERLTGFAFTLRELIMLGVQHAAPRSAAETARLVARAMRCVGLDGLGERSTDRLSGGERQRAHLARALVQFWTGLPCDCGGGILLLDEPLSAQDPLQQILILDLVRDLAGQGATVLIVLHDINAAVRVAARIVVLRDGAAIAAGAPDEVVTTGVLRTAFDIDLVPRAVPPAPLPFVLPQMARRSMSPLP